MDYTENAKQGKGRRRIAWGLSILLSVAVLAVAAAVIALDYGRNVVAAGFFEDGIVNDSGGQKKSYTGNGWRKITMSDKDLAIGDLVLVSNSVPYSFDADLDLVSIYDEKTNSYYVRDKNVLLSRRVMEPLNRMMDDFYAQTGLKSLNVVAGWRSFNEQENIYAECLAENGADYTASYVANPGCSEHHTGLAVDLSIYHSDDGTSEKFLGEDDYAWISENAWKYGFVQRYESGKETTTMISDEPWHFRYVGVPHAYIMKQRDLCLEEYIDFLKNYPYDGEHYSVECQGNQYEIYACEGFEVPVPDAEDWTVSGNNVDGFIVTICES